MEGKRKASPDQTANTKRVARATATRPAEEAAPRLAEMPTHSNHQSGMSVDEHYAQIGENEEDENNNEEDNETEEGVDQDEIVYLYAAKSRTHAIPCQLRIGLLTDTVTFIPDASTRLDNVDLVFDRDSRVRLYRFSKGWTLRFVNCGKYISKRAGPDENYYKQDVEFLIPYPEEHHNDAFLLNRERLPFPWEMHHAIYNAEVLDICLESIKRAVGATQFAEPLPEEVDSEHIGFIKRGAQYRPERH